jgi:uncharacterized RDD family membrane protein YckC
MQDPNADMVVATPERVAFEYRAAGPGSRFVAQLIDLIVLAGAELLITVAAVAFADITGQNGVAALLGILLGFVLVVGYFWTMEALWSGKTLGKFVMGLRVVGDLGEPLTFTAASIRNLVRIVDFLPFFYGLGLVVLFVNGRGKRLGDLAAGTIVVRDREAVSLRDLTQPAVPAFAPMAPPPPELDEPLLRRLDPNLRTFVRAYSGRRHQLSPAQRQWLADQVAPALDRALPEVVRTQGNLAALDRLAGY